MMNKEKLDAFIKKCKNVVNENKEEIRVGFVLGTAIVISYYVGMASKETKICRELDKAVDMGVLDLGVDWSNGKTDKLRSEQWFTSIRYDIRKHNSKH